MMRNGQRVLKTGPLARIAAIVLATAVASLVAFASDTMSVQQQNALVTKYCAVCHTDAIPNGGLSLQHFDAANVDPGVAAMVLGKLKTGAIGAAGIKPPDQPTIQTWIDETSKEAVGAKHWTVSRTQAPSTNGPIVHASIVRDLPSAVSKDVPDSYRLAVTCRADTHEGEILLSWSPGVPKQGQVFSVFADGQPLSNFKIQGTEKMGNGQTGDSGPGAVVLYPTKDASGAAKALMDLPMQTLTIRDAFPNESVVFPFGELAPADRQALSECFSGAFPRDAHH